MDFLGFLLIGFAVYDKIIYFSIRTLHVRVCVCVCVCVYAEVCSSLIFFFFSFCSTLILLIETNFFGFSKYFVVNGL